MKCLICGSISLPGEFCGVCGTRFDQASYKPQDPVLVSEHHTSPRTLLGFAFWISLIPLGWYLFNFDFTDILSGQQLPYVYAFPFVGIPLILVGFLMALITIWDSLVQLVPQGVYTWRQGFREKWKSLGTGSRFIIVSTVGEMVILGVGWALATILGLDFHGTMIVILGVFWLFGVGLIQGRPVRYSPRSRRYDDYLRRQAAKISKPKGRWLIPALYLLWTTLTIAVVLLV